MSLPYKTIVVVGDPQVGKTLFSRFLLQESSSSKDLLELTDNYQPNKYYQLCMINLEVLKGSSIYLQLWDTPGLPELHTSNEIYHTKAVYLLIIDLERKESFQSIFKWRKHIEGLLKKDKAGSDYDCLIFGNKPISQTHEWVNAQRLREKMREWRGRNAYKEVCLSENPSGARRDLRDFFIDQKLFNLSELKSSLAPPKPATEQVESNSHCVIM